ncbi:MAG: amidase [Rhodobacteraceae bacterium]|nr:amidase [Paracoccaceae bacterium]
MDDDLFLGRATSAAARLRARDIGALEMLEGQFARIDRLNPQINAVVWQDRQSARARAAELDAMAARGEFAGPLHGLPVTVKEAFDLVGSPSTWGNPALRDNIATRDSDVVARLRAAGAIVFGKSNVPLNLVDWQSFNEIYGTTSNPWDLGRTPGGSSGGSAAVLAAGMAMLEAGSDIGSSIRNPAHYCGVFGLKPTHGVISRFGHAKPGWLGDTDIAVVGPMARSAEDLSLAFDVLLGAGGDHAKAWTATCPPDSRTRLSEFRVAVMLGSQESPVDDGYLAELEDFGRRMQAAGATVSFEVRPEVDAEAQFEMYLTLLGAAMSAAQTEQEITAESASLATLDDPRARWVATRRVGGKSISHRRWLELDNARLQALARFEAFFADWDILLTPVCCSAAFAHDQDKPRFWRSIPVNGAQQSEPLNLFWAGYSGVVGLPSCVGPMTIAKGLPLGYQAIAGTGRDRTALAFARAAEAELTGFTAPPMAVQAT